MDGQSEVASAMSTTDRSPTNISAHSNGALDVLSPNFDAALALRSKHIRLPHKVAALDNLYKARGLLPSSHPHFSAYILLDRHKQPQSNQKKISTRAAQTAASAIASTSATLKATRRSAVEQDEKYSNVMIALAENATEGPMMVLKNAFDSRKRVVITTRGIGGVRGTCVGFIKAFDRHMNLLLFDVDETYRTVEHLQVSIDNEDKSKNNNNNKNNNIRNSTTNPEWVCRPSKRHEGRCFYYNTKSGKSQWTTPANRKFRNKTLMVERIRHLPQVVLRGDCVLMVAIPPLHTSLAAVRLPEKRK